MKKRLLALFMATMMFVSILPTSAFAADGVTEFDNAAEALKATGVEASKTITRNEDGTYKITLSVTGTSKTTTNTQSIPADVILVVDTSTSMNDTVSRTYCGGALTEETREGSGWGGTYEYTVHVCETCGAEYSNYGYGGVPDACTAVVSTTNRLDVAKAAAQQFVAGLLDASNDIKIGLYDFSGSNRTNLALTNDADTLSNAITNLSMPRNGDGTYYDLGLSGAAALLQNSAEDRAKFVVFLSDGEPTSGHNGQTQANTLKADKVTIFTIGVDVNSGGNAENRLKTIASEIPESDPTSTYYYAASTSGDSGTALDDVLATIQKVIEDTIHAGKNGVMVDLVNTDAFELVDGTASEGLTASEDGSKLTWDIGDITKETKTVTFDVALKDGVVPEGQVFTNDGVSLTFDSTALDGQPVKLITPAIGAPCIYGMVINGDTVTKTYNGEAQSVANTDFSWEYLPEGFDVTNVTIDVQGEGINAGEYPTKVNIDKFIVKDADGNDITDLCVVTEKNDGKLIITPKSVTLESATASKQYDGTPLTADDVAVVKGEFYGNDDFTYEVTGSQTLVGSSDNTFTYQLTEGTIAGNYDINVKYGKLTVANRSNAYEIAVTPNSGEFKYDGSEKTVSDFETLIFEVEGNTYTVSGLTASASGTDVGEYIVEIIGDAVVKDVNNNDVTDQFTVSKNTGKLTITPRAVVLTSETASKEYDGTALTKPEVTVSGDGFVAGEVSDIKATGSVTYPNENATNTITYTENAAFDADNYVITKNEGTLSITSREAKYEVSVEANSDTFLYDGTEKSVEGFKTLTVTADNGLQYTISGLTASANGTDANTYTTEISGTAVVTDSNGRDVTSEFDVTAIPGELKINKRQVTLTSADDTKEYDGEPLTNDEITVSGDGFAAGEGATYNVTGTRTLVGSAANAFTYALNEGTKAANYEISKVEGNLTVTNRTAKYEITVVANSDDFTYDGEEKTVEGFKTLTFTVDGNTYTVSGLNASATATNAGEYAVTVTGTPVVQDAEGNVVTDQFAVNTENGLMTIDKREITLTSATASKQYDGKALTNDEVTVSGDGWAEGEGAEYTVTGSQKLPGESVNAFTYALNEGTNADNYEIKKVEGKLSVTDREVKFEITVEANSGSKLYDGESMTVSGFKTLDFTFDGVPFTVEGLTASVTGTDAGDYTNAISGTAIVKDADGNDVTSQFIVKTVDGQLTITKRSVTLTSATDSKQYDGSALTNKNVTVSGDGFAAGEGATYNVTGRQLIVGSSSNAFTYTLNRGTNADNYIITEVPGTLTVMNREAKYEITVEANSDEFKYDGTEKTVSGFKTLTFEVEGNTYTVSGLSASANGTDAGAYTAEVTGRAIVKDADGNDVTAQFAVKTVNGTLTITKRDVTLTSATDSKEYDGYALTNAEVTVSGEGFASGEGASYNVTGSQTLVGTSENAFTYTLNEGTKADNYNVTTNNGTLTVVNRNAKFEITVEANSGEFKYDGSEKTVSGFETLTFTVNGLKFTVSDLTAETTKTDAGEYAVNVVGTPVVKDADGNDVSAQFAVYTENGTLVITKRSVTLTSATASKEYDGSALTNDTVTVTGEGFAAGEGATYNVIGSQTLVGSSPNTFSYTLNEGTKAENYDITKVEGTLTVDNRSDKYKITVEANSAEYTYDGAEKTVSGFKTLTFTVDGNTYTVSGLTAEVSATAPGIYTAEVAGTAVVKDNNGNDVTAQFAVSTVNGTLTINPVVTVEYYLEDRDGNITKIESVDNGQDNPFVVQYGEGFNIVIGEGEGTYVAPAAIVSNDLSYAFDAFAEALSAESVTDNVTIKLYYAVDTWNDEEDDDDKKDGIPDKHQAMVTYKVVNGTWDGTDAEDQIKIFTVETQSAETGEWTAIDVTLAGTIPTGMQPDNKHIVPGAWDVAITDETPVTESVTYTYTFDIEKILALNVEKSVDVIKVKVGDSVTYTIKVSNTGNVALTDVTVTDTFSGNIDKISIKGTLPEGVTYDGDGVFTIDELDVKEAVIIIFTYKTTSADKGTLTNTVVAESTPEDTEDPVKDEDDAENVEVRNDITPTGPIKPVLSKKDHFAYIIGYPDGTVRPQNNITRAEVATIFFRLLEEESRENFWSQTNWYTDVSLDDWFNNAISTLSNAGIITGYPDGSFGPNLPITRAEFATIASRFAEVEYNGGNTFTDVPEDHWAARYISLAQHLGYIQGYPDGTFKPNQYITRAEAMTLINRVLERAVEKEHMLEDMLVFVDNVPGTWYYEAVQEATNSHEYERRSELVPNQTFKYEYWIEILTPPDWAALERVWSEANNY